MTDPTDMECLAIEDTGGLGSIELLCPVGGLTVTPASRLAVATIGRHRDLLVGIGLDWGSGVGALSIAAARLKAVERVVGLEIVERDVELARRNALANGVAEKVDFLHSDDFSVFDDGDRETLSMLEGRAGFLLANPPASSTGDGLDWRRSVLSNARRFLTPGGPLLVQISYQYSEARMRLLADEVTGIRYEGLLHHSKWIDFDQDRPDLRRQVEEYAEVEEGGGLVYTFGHPADPENRSIDAREALRRFRETGEHPLSRWEMHLYRYEP